MSLKIYLCLGSRILQITKRKLHFSVNSSCSPNWVAVIETVWRWLDWKCFWDSVQTREIGKWRTLKPIWKFKTFKEEGARERSNIRVANYQRRTKNLSSLILHSLLINAISEFLKHCYSIFSISRNSTTFTRTVLFLFGSHIENEREIKFRIGCWSKIAEDWELWL